MTYKQPKILIPTCDKYISDIEALQYSVRGTKMESFKYIIIGYKKPDFKLDKYFEFVSLGQDRGAGNWSNDMIKFMETFSDEVFIYGNDDCAISFIDDTRLEIAIAVTNKHQSVGRFALMAEGKARPMVPFSVLWFNESLQNEMVNINQFSRDAPYRLSLGWSVWRKKCFMQFCKPNLTPWMFELQSVSGEKSDELHLWNFCTFNPSTEAIDAAFFRRKNITGIIPDWHKAYYGHDLSGEIKDEIEKILFKKNA